MIPLKDTIPSQTWPFVTWAIIAANFFFFYVELSQGPAINDFISEFGVIPYTFSLRLDRHLSFWPAVFDRYAPLFTSIFLHGGWLHLLGNMLFLWIFGDNVEDRLGHFRFLFFYLLCGITASVAHIIVNSTSTMPTIGASGAIAGVLGAYMLLYPRARIKTLIIIFIFIDIIELPAVFFLLFWFALQLVSGVGSVGDPGNSGGVAWFAHIGGFICGMIAVFILKKRNPEKRRPPRISRYEEFHW